MQQDCEMLNEIRKTTKMGQVGIHSVMKGGMSGEFHNVLQSQLREYDAIYQEADQLLHEHGGTPKNLSAFAKWGNMMATSMKMKSDGSRSKVAEMMIEGNTKGMIKSIQSIRTMGVLDPKVSALSNRLLQTEQANIDQMKAYL